MAIDDLVETAGEADQEVNLSRSQLTRAYQALTATFRRKMHVDELIHLAKGKWLEVDRMEVDSDRTTVYLKLTIKIKLGQK